jgi:hypothetical protein
MVKSQKSGSKFHELLRQRLVKLNDKVLHPEVSYLKESPAEWGSLGTSRVDISLGDKSKPFGIMCLKTLKALPSAQQERGWLKNVPRLKDGSVAPRFYLKVERATE